MNKQNKNVGNLGDILKHAALVELAKLIQSRNPRTRINYLDTHTYLVESKCSNGNWRSDAAELLSKHSGYKDYIALESSLVESGKYLCSSGLALALLKEPALFLAESDNDTRIRLIEQLRHIKVGNFAIKSNMHEYAKFKNSSKKTPIIALVDPLYKADDKWQKVWRSACHGISELHCKTDDGIIILFRWDKSPFALWFDAPDGFSGPIATITRQAKNNKGFFNIAAYATNNMTQVATKSLLSLGWNKNGRLEHE